MGVRLKLAFIDIGELGWSMYISAHVRWYKERTGDEIAVMTYPDRRCLYDGLADVVMSVPDSFYTLFDTRRQNCLGIQKVPPDVMRKFFSEHLTNGFSIPEYFIMRCKPQFGDKLIFQPYKYSKKIEGSREVLVFPRRRLGGWYSYRNLNESFYIELIKRLCDERPDLNIRTIGTTMGAYDINVNKPNYINHVGKGDGLQDMIDHCQLAVSAVGSQSGPPKIALLQGVPTYMIGHQRERHMRNENWMSTPTSFFTVPDSDYSKINENECIEEIVSFVGRFG